MTTTIHPSKSPTPVRKIARLVQNLNRKQKARLLQLVPELQTIRPEEADILPEQEALMAAIHSKYPELAERDPLQEDEPFLGGLTFGEFFALPEQEQARIWDEAIAQVEREIDTVEHTVLPDALPAR